MKHLNELKWDALLLSNLFSFDKGNQNNMASLQEGNIPLVSAKKCDNGYKTFIQKNNKRLYSGHCITLNNDGDGGAGLAYYQPYQMALDSHVTALIPKVPMSKHTLLFIARSISKQRKLFGHGRSINASRLRIFRLMLPVTEENVPDYEFMDSYMKDIERQLLTQYKSYIEINYLSNQNGGGKMKDISWKEFSLNEICNIKSGVRLVARDMKEGNTPFVGATDSGNGLTKFISNTNASIDSNVLGVNYNGNGVAIGFYHPYKALFSDDVKRVKIKDNEGNKYVYLFLKASILKQKDKYQYGYKFSGERMNRQKVMLPSTPTGCPDYKYMERYMRRQEMLLLNKYMDKYLK